MDRNGLLNIYEQYYRAGLKYGFYLRESTWKSIGQVMFIVGVTEGEKGKGPIRPLWFLAVPKGSQGHKV
ncbi:hypothetical protein K8352_17605 [Flavobacteriaceae bacterium F89]|uniref:Uncharacterized protein n=1 Tax=Cerina litoralis TaxID=2874477 RepID=A0AAE3EWW2_9FLAO|nr:hypothetical protein [Cerina litoralis]MCG2462582.1 hypothetical protein [Cerina litoralis]